MDAAVDVHALMQEMGARAREAAATLAYAPSAQKDAALTAAADAIWEGRADLLAANAADMADARAKGLSGAMLDRLALDEARVRGMVDGLRAIAAQADPVGAVMAEWDRPSGLHIRRVRTPIGVDRGDLREPAERDRRRGRRSASRPGTRRSCAAGRRACARRRRSMPGWRRGSGRRACRRPRSSWCR